MFLSITRLTPEDGNPNVHVDDKCSFKICGNYRNILAFLPTEESSKFPIKWLSKALSQAVKLKKLITHLHLVPSLRVCGAVIPLPLTP
jgi:hypothetical protein